MVISAINRENILATDYSQPRAGGDMVDDNFHQPVMWQEALACLLPEPGGVYVDGTTGEGGHAQAILQAEPQAQVLGIDRDPRSLARAEQRLEQYGPRFIPAQGSYAQMADLARERGFQQADGILLDLGFSSRQIEAPGYGFSFQRDEPLDMRYDPAIPRTAADLINRLSPEELARLINHYGEEPRARAISRSIVRLRPLHTTRELAQAVEQAVGRRGGQRIHPATRTFQALRIAVNDELGHLEKGLAAAITLLAKSGRLVVISYHSLEDRVVKNFMAQESASCICPPRLPVCVCGHQPTVKIVNRRIIKPTAEEIQSNPRSRSARMRAAQRL